MRYRIGHILSLGLILLNLATAGLQAAGLEIPGFQTVGTQAAETKVSLWLEKNQAIAGEPVMAGVHFKLKQGWHTYWRYGGDAAQPPSILWSLPDGVQAGTIRWPLPVKEESVGLYSYSYHDEVTLLVPLTLSADLKPGPLEIKAKIAWLECDEACVPKDGNVAATFTVGDTNELSEQASLLASWNAKVPPVAKDIKFKADWSGNVAEDERKLTFELAGEQGFHWKDFYPFENEAFEIGGATELGSPVDKPLSITKSLLNWEENWPNKVSGIAMLAKDDGSETVGYEITVELGKDFATNASQASAAAPTKGETGTPPGASPEKDASGPSYPVMLAFAFIGGFILNFMPCVLPVISLKILGFVQQSKEAPKRIFQMGLLYGMGVLFSFWIMAGLVIGVQSAGKLANWGMQFQNPQFLVLMTLLVTLVALNFFGVFEITGGRLTGAASAVASREGNMGAFFNGVLATVLATPCTAPFLGSALGFAFTQPPAGIFLFFTTVALGLAFPYVLLSWNPAWLGVLPKPGPWMERFKVFMGFPMLATAVWLYTIARLHFGEGSDLWMGLLIVTVALGAWIFGEFVQRGGQRKGLALGVSLACLAFAYGYILENELNWRHPMDPNAKMDTKTIQGKNGIVWHPWSEEAVAAARKEGKVVLVDFTAKWCQNCQVNKKTSIEIDEVRNKLSSVNGLTMRGDYTFYDPEITKQLQKHERSGVPLVLIFSPDPSSDPIILPELLTPSLVLNALDQAADKGNEVALNSF